MPCKIITWLTNEPQITNVDLEDNFCILNSISELVQKYENTDLASFDSSLITFDSTEYSF